jgi:nitroimidazol reductase NimA-like FMN-containing flavoprotein (pyridoxamine 5'-phosphate oxidase superfamily)
MGKMRGLYPDEIQAFLDGHVVARIATIDSRGYPYITPVWQEWDRQAMWVIPREKTVFVQHLKSNPRVAVSCALDSSPYTRALFCGSAEIVAGPAPMHGDWLAMARRMALRYLGERGPEYLEPSLGRPRYWVKITPETTITWEGVEWAAKYMRD